jgi:hypothetical protein
MSFLRGLLQQSDVKASSSQPEVPEKSLLPPIAGLGKMVK